MRQGGKRGIEGRENLRRGEEREPQAGGKGRKEDGNHEGRGGASERKKNAGKGKNAGDDKITVVRGIPGDIVIFGIEGTRAEAGGPSAIGSGQAKQPTAVPGELAVLGSGVNQDKPEILDYCR